MKKHIHTEHSAELLCKHSSALAHYFMDNGLTMFDAIAILDNTQSVLISVLKSQGVTIGKISNLRVKGKTCH